MMNKCLVIFLFTIPAKFAHVTGYTVFTLVCLGRFAFWGEYLISFHHNKDEQSVTLSNFQMACEQKYFNIYTCKM